MLVNSITALSQNKTLEPVRSSKNYSWKNSSQDVFSKSLNPVPQIYSESGKKYLKVVTFTGLNNPLSKVIPAIQMRVTGVTRFQDNMKPEFIKNHNLYSVNRLADSKWKDGDPLEFKILNGMRGEMIALSSKEFGEIGRVPDEISPKLLNLLKSDAENYRFELSNVIAGNTKGAATIGLRVNLLYDGKTPEPAQEAFNEILNDPEASKKALFYQPKTSPEEVLKQILIHEEKENGVEAARKMEEIVENIVKQIDSPKNKRILLVGHCKPDGDTLGCILGLKHSINMVHQDKIVDCAVDDEITGLFRHKLPGIDGTVKHPFSQAKIDLLNKELALAEQSGDKIKVTALKHSLEQATDKNLLLDANDKYDLVILMDVPSPSRFSSGFKDYIKNAGETIYIEHHPLRQEEWDKSIETIGVDMSKIIKNKLAWIAERVPAATEQAVIIASKLLPEKNPLNSANYIKTANSVEPNSHLNAAVASFATGMWTDTGGFSRTANLLPSDIIDEKGAKVPVQSRPNFLPEGLSKWLFSLTPNSIDKKWMREVITYDISDTKTIDLPETAREKMIRFAEEHKIDNKDFGVGFITASYNEMQDVLKTAQIDDLSTGFLDVQNAFKYSEIMGQLREPGKNNALQESVDAAEGVIKEAGPYDKDRIAVFVCESEKAGELNTEGEKSAQNALRFSFRSQEGTTHAELLASLFSGGGHGGAAGGHIKGDNVTLDSTFNIKINGIEVRDKDKVLSTLQKNYEVMHDKNIAEASKAGLCSKIELIKDDKGETPIQIIEKLVFQIRAHQA